jgi:hypothetical protein
MSDPALVVVALCMAGCSALLGLALLRCLLHAVGL